MRDSLLEAVGDKRQDLLILIQQQHDPQISQSFIAKPWARNKFEAFDLTKVSRVAEHVDVEEFCDIVVTGEAVFVFE